MNRVIQYWWCDNEVYYCAILLVFTDGFICQNHTPEQILQMINGKGAMSVVAELDSNDTGESEWWNHVIPEISKGTQAWLAVASALELRSGRQYG